MRKTALLIASAAAILACSAQSAGATAHYVQPGESLWSIASANGITAGTLAAANGLAADAQIISGTTIDVPVGGTTTSTSSTSQAVQSSSGGGHLVQSGESLWSIASANGTSVDALAAANGLSSTAQIITGTSLTIPGGSSSAQSACDGCAGNVPVPTAERVSSGQVGDVASSYGMSRSLVQAIGWQESGFNNAALSSANARGVMQIIPSTWKFINNNLAGGTLNPASAHDNVAAGALYLRYLYRLKGGDRDATIGSYYQGPGRETVLPETQRYVSSVLGFKDWYARSGK
jgi:LysM repeat protein